MQHSADHLTYKFQAQQTYSHLICFVMYVCCERRFCTGSNFLNKKKWVDGWGGTLRQGRGHSLFLVDLARKLRTPCLRECPRKRTKCDVRTAAGAALTQHHSQSGVGIFAIPLSSSATIENIAHPQPVHASGPSGYRTDCNATVWTVGQSDILTGNWPI